MNVEASSSALLASAINNGLENKPQAVTASGTLPDAFTTTLQEQLQQFNNGIALTPAGESLLTTPASPAVTLPDTATYSAPVIDLKSALQALNANLRPQNPTPTLAAQLPQPVTQVSSVTPALQTLGANLTAQNTTQTLAGQSLQPVAQPSVSALVSQALDANLSPQNSIQTLSVQLPQPVSQAPTQPSPAILVAQALSTHLTPQNATQTLSAQLSQLASKASPITPSLQTLGANLTAQNTTQTLAGQSLQPVAQPSPSVSASVSQALDANLSPKNSIQTLSAQLPQPVSQASPAAPVLPTLATHLRRDTTVGWGEVTNPNNYGAPSVGVPIVTPTYSGLAAELLSQPSAATLALQSFNANLTPQHAPQPLSTPIKPLLGQVSPALSTPATVNAYVDSRNTLQQLSEILQQANTAQSIAELLMQPDGMQELSALLGKQLPVAKKLEKEVNLETTLQTLAEVIARIPEVNNEINAAANLDFTLPQAMVEGQEQASEAPTETDELNKQDTTTAGLLQAGIIQPLAPNTPVATASKTESPVDGLNANALQTMLPQTVADTKKMPDTVTPSAQLAELKPDSALNNPWGLKDSNTQKTSFASTLDNVKLTESNPALDNLAKALPGMSAEMTPFERQSSISSKVDVPAMTTHLYSPEWNKELGTKIIWMTQQNISSAELKLNPQHLGPISIHIDMQQDQASISFTAQNAGVKEMLEASIPKLRDMLQSQQLNLLDVNVSQQSFSGQGQPQTPFFGQANAGQKHAAPERENSSEQSSQVNDVTDHIEQSRTLVSNGLVSLYA